MSFGTEIIAGRNTWTRIPLVEEHDEKNLKSDNNKHVMKKSLMIFLGKLKIQVAIYKQKRDFCSNKQLCQKTYPFRTVQKQRNTKN